MMESREKISKIEKYAIVYSIAIGVWFLFSTLFNDNHWLLWILNSLAKYLFLPGVFFGAFCLLKRNWEGLRWLIIPLIIFSVLYGELFLPSINPQYDSGVRSINVMTYNILNRNTEFEELGELIITQKPDVIGVQELIPANSSAIEPILSRNGYPFHTPLPKEHKLDVGVFSRYPIIDINQLNLPWRDLSWHAIIDFEGTNVHVFVIHLIPTLVGEVPLNEWPSRIREREVIRMDQITRVLEALPDTDEPVLVACDCNFTETTEAYARFDDRLEDSFRKAGWGFGHTIHPVGLSIGLNRIDYIWHSPHFVTKNVYVVNDGPSDHFAVVADLVLLDGGG